MSVGVVTQHLYELIAKQVEDHRLIVWYDPDQVYSVAVAELAVPDATVACYNGSFFQLRHDIDPLMNGEQPPRLVVYIPEDRGNIHHALIELEAAGAIIQPGQQPPTRNTRLAIVARNALKPILGDKTAAEIEKQVETGKLSLADLNALADRGKDISTGVLSLVFGTAKPHDIALAFLHSDAYDAEIKKRSAQTELAHLFQQAFQVNLPKPIFLSESRTRLARHVLLTELVIGLGKTIPSSLASVAIASEPGAIHACIELAHTWRMRRDVRESYVITSKQIEQEFTLSQLAFNPEQIVDIETFPAIEKALIRHVEQALLESADHKLLVLARSRLSRFWSDVMPSIQAHWALIAAIVEVLLEADRVAKALKKAPSTVPALIRAYTEGDSPWCRLDTYHRHMESRWYNFEPVLGEDHSSLEKLIVKAEQRYAEIGSELAKHFITQFHKAHHPVKGDPRGYGVPHGDVTKEELAELVEMALEGRRRVKEQLKKMGSFEYHQTSFSYIDSETREERYVGVPEEGRRDLITPDPLAPGSLYTASVDDQGKVGLYRLEVGCSAGTGKLRVAGSAGSAMREAIQRAFAYIQGHKVNMGSAQIFDTTDFHVEAIDLLTNRVPCDTGIVLVVAIYSALKKQAALPGLLVLGDLSIQGNIKAVRSLAEPLQVAMDNGARRALIPIENKRHFLDVSADIMERVDPIFYSDPLTAAMKALGMN